MNENTQAVEAPENVKPADTKAQPVPKPPTKAQLKKMEIYAQRRQRLINKGVPEAQVDAVIAREDYERLPVAEKLKRLEHFVASALGQLGQEMGNLRHNDGVLADAMDVNFRSIAKALTKAGVSMDDQKKIVEEVQKEMEAEAQARAEAAEKAQKEVEEKARASDTKQVDVPGEAPAAPAEATTFGG